MSDRNAPSSAGGHGAPTGRHRAAARAQVNDPVTAATLLRAALAERGISGRVKAVDADTGMLLAGEQIVLCRDGCFWWATGRFREGRSITGVHDAADPAGAARRLARARPPQGIAPRQ
jgi:hypothetical protein